MRSGWVILAAAALVLAPACKKGGGAEAPKTVTLNGAGASFPFPLYSKWVSEYHKLHDNVRINYQSIGSGGGIRQITERTVDFGASDVPMTDAQLAKVSGTLLHIPTTLGAVVVTYNVAGVPAGLKLTGETVAGIFLGEIKQWNDERLAKLNPGLALPQKPIAVVHRSDGSGTTAVFTGYLSAVSPAWKQKVGTGTSVSWPLGLGGKGNEGVTGQVKTTPGALGYVELAYAVQNHLPYAHIKNQAGTFVSPSVAAITAAAAGAAASMPADLRVSIVNAPGPDAYPISAFTYILVYQDNPDRPKAEALAGFLWWAIHAGQQYAAPLDYAPLPPAVVTKVEAKLKTMTSGGAPLLP